MSPFMFLIVLGVLTGVAVLLMGLLFRKRWMILVGAPAGLLLVAWFIAAGIRPDPQKEFDRLFGAENRKFVSDIQTRKPRLADGHFVSFRIGSGNFAARIRPNFTEVPFQPGIQSSFKQAVPGWPETITEGKTVLHREVKYSDVYLIYFPNEEKAYVTVRYPQW
jgi:hypothetical protein